ncbi:peptidase [Hafnia alvei]|uniref:Endoglucanase/putative aminopeptidase FrvX n=1 Tax=Hafnia alvei TaxID=569 RepID=A0A1C6Z602_HAFAL|nr:peptidase [Hafnia alvei]NLS54949.1 peptidase [Hafnia alvei]SCM54309.1 endoglucanase/putative aminopeptidase FrvX [Hafnia alvei]
MNINPLSTALLETLCNAHGVSGDEHEIREILHHELQDHADEITFDGLGSFIAKKGSKGPKVAIVAHMDEVGMMVKFISNEGYLYFDTIGSWWNQSMLNHRMQIRTRSGNKILGIVGSIAPHALNEKQKQSPIELDDMFIDVGASSAKAVEAMGIAVGDFICPEPNYSLLGANRVLAKALDNRAGCALAVELFKQVSNPDITLYSVATVQEEVGLRGAQASAETIKPDIVIVIDTAVAGDIPGINTIKFPLRLDAGPAVMLFDKRYFPHQKLTAEIKSCAVTAQQPLQVCTMKTGATDAGRYNVMGGGRPVVALCLPTRYLHANSSMISIQDYRALSQILNEFLQNYNAAKHLELSRYL